MTRETRIHQLDKQISLIRGTRETRGDQDYSTRKQIPLTRGTRGGDQDLSTRQIYITDKGDQSIQRGPGPN